MSLKETRSPLANAKGLGAAKNGVNHWWSQRISAIALIPLIIWFIITVIRIANADHFSYIAILKSPGNMIGLMLLLITAIYHGMQGMQVIIEDYSKEPLRMILIILMKLLSVATIIASLAAIFAFHFSSLN